MVYKTLGEWKNGQKIYTLRHNGPEHVLCYAPPRSGKGVGLVIPTMLTWPHSAVVTDLKREIYELTAGWRSAYRWEDLTKAPVSPSMLLNPRRYGDGAKDLWATLNCVQENIIRGGQRDRSRRRPDGGRMPKSRAIKGIDEDMKLNKALWEMAQVLRARGAH